MSGKTPVRCSCFDLGNVDCPRCNDVKNLAKQNRDLKRRLRALAPYVEDYGMTEEPKRALDLSKPFSQAGR